MRLEHSQMGMLIAKERLADVGEVVGREAVKLFSKAADDFSQNLGGVVGASASSHSSLLVGHGVRIIPFLIKPPHPAPPRSNAKP